ncbi:hypothetical protein FACS189431_2100 [Alphaproteobacteria bacterium]|nr:hypothetical protein FACS189431_2100 [Alphaproteobacteria bacterium]
MENLTNTELQQIATGECIHLPNTAVEECHECLDVAVYLQHLEYCQVNGIPAEE